MCCECDASLISMHEYEYIIYIDIKINIYTYMYNCEYVLIIPNSKICPKKKTSQQPREQQCKKTDHHCFKCQSLLETNISYIIYHPQNSPSRDFLGPSGCAADETHHPAPRRPPVGHPSLSRSAHGSRWRRPSKGSAFSEWYMGVCQK